MKELWDAKGYGDLGLLSQNLRDQAARLEKTLQESTRNLACDAKTEGAANSRVFVGGNLSRDAQIGANSKAITTVPSNTDLSILEEIESESQCANLLTTSSKDLHTTRTSQIPGDQEEIEQGENNVNRPGCLLDYNTVYKPFMINWGKRGDGSAIFIPTSIITDAYNEIATWRKNIFLLPYGKVGRDFIDQITLHINGWNSGSDNQHICLKAAFVLLPLGLQKPNAKSKAKDHQDVLSKRIGDKLKSTSYYANVELFKVVSGNSRRRTRPIDLRFLPRKKMSEKFLRKRLLMSQCKGRNISGRW